MIICQRIIKYKDNLKLCSNYPGNYKYWVSDKHCRKYCKVYVV